MLFLLAKLKLLILCLIWWKRFNVSCTNYIRCITLYRQLYYLPNIKFSYLQFISHFYKLKRSTASVYIKLHLHWFGHLKHLDIDERYLTAEVAQMRRLVISVVQYPCSTNVELTLGNYCITFTINCSQRPWGPEWWAQPDWKWYTINIFCSQMIFTLIFLRFLYGIVSLFHLACKRLHNKSKF